MLFVVWAAINVMFAGMLALISLQSDNIRGQSNGRGVIF